jgi:hypothetical protein
MGLLTNVLLKYTLSMALQGVVTGKVTKSSGLDQLPRKFRAETHKDSVEENL